MLSFSPAPPEGNGEKVNQNIPTFRELPVPKHFDSRTKQLSHLYFFYGNDCPFSRKVEPEAVCLENHLFSISFFGFLI